MWMDVISILILLLALIYEGSELRCGIRIVTWTTVYIISLFLRITIATTRTFILNHFPDISSIYNLTSFLLIDIFMLSWQIYGIQLIG